MINNTKKGNCIPFSKMLKRNETNIANKIFFKYLDESETKENFTEKWNSWVETNKDKELNFSKFYFDINDIGVKKFFKYLIRNEKSFDFAGLSFPKVSFNNSIFTRSVSFSKCNFKSKSSFLCMVFHNDCWFDATFFEDEISFSDSIFHNNLQFKNSISKALINFSKAKFLKKVYFSSSFFKRAIFSSSKFEKEVDLSHLKINYKNEKMEEINFLKLILNINFLSLLKKNQMLF